MVPAPPLTVLVEQYRRTLELLDTLNQLALDRATFIYSFGKTAGGKKIIDIGKEKSVDSLFGMIAIAIKPDFRFRPSEAKQFFENKGLSPEREAEFIDSMNRNRELLRQTYNGTFAYNTTKTLYTSMPDNSELIPVPSSGSWRRWGGI